jgi:8-oxo-dGTP diphosphatase
MLKEKQQKVIVGALVYKEGKFLIVRRAGDEKVFPERWDFPGGNIEFGEDPISAVIREVKEETNLDLDELELFDIRSYTYKIGETLKHNIDITYLFKPKKGQVKLSEEHEAFAWINSSNIHEYDLFGGVPELIKKAELKLKNGKKSN